MSLPDAQRRFGHGACTAVCIAWAWICVSKDDAATFAFKRQFEKSSYSQSAPYAAPDRYPVFASDLFSFTSTTLEARPLVDVCLYMHYQQVHPGVLLIFMRFVGV